MARMMNLLAVVVIVSQLLLAAPPPPHLSSSYLLFQKEDGLDELRMRELEPMQFNSAAEFLRHADQVFSLVEVKLNAANWNFETNITDANQEFLTEVELETNKVRVMSEIR